MKFGAVPIAESAGAIVAHAIHHESFTLKKGDTVTEQNIAALGAAGIAEIVVARLEASDVAENEAARQLAGAMAGEAVTIDRAFTGRANIFAQAAGILRIDTECVDRINGITEAITLATLPAYRTVAPGEMVATVKIIPFAVPRADLDKAIAAIGDPLVDVSPFRPMSVGVISTVLPGLKASVITKTLSHLADRLAPAGARIVADERVAHDAGCLSRLLRATVARCDLVVIFGASAITDRRDVIPAALIEAGGEIEHFGMPVDPGNLLLLGRIGPVPVIGAPGCARSPKENGFDWILHRLLAGVPVRADDIRRLGVGGLLMEIVSRPQLRSGAEKPKAAPRSSPTTLTTERRGSTTP